MQTEPDLVQPKADAISSGWISTDYFLKRSTPKSLSSAKCLRCTLQLCPCGAWTAPVKDWGCGQPDVQMEEPSQSWAGEGRHHSVHPTLNTGMRSSSERPSGTAWVVWLGKELCGRTSRDTGHCWDLLWGHLVRWDKLRSCLKPPRMCLAGHLTSVFKMKPQNVILETWRFWAEMDIACLDFGDFGVGTSAVIFMVF